jgi:hypothetical protein
MYRVSFFLRLRHRNLRTRRRMHFCMPDNPIGPKYMGWAPADMARLPHFINTKKISSKQPSLSAGATPTMNLPMENVHFWLDILLVLRFQRSARGYDWRGANPFVRKKMRQIPFNCISRWKKRIFCFEFFALQFFFLNFCWGRCYGHNFRRLLTIFREKKMAFFSKSNDVIKFLNYLALFWVKSANLLTIFWRKYL